MTRRTLVLAALALLAAAAPALAENKSWQGQSFTPDWTGFLNWSPFGAATAADDVFITDLAIGQGDSTSVDQDFDIASLTLSGNTTTDTGGNVLDVAGDVTVGGFTQLIALEHNSGPTTTVLEADNLIVETSGQFILRGGRVDVFQFGPGAANAGSVNVAANGQLAGFGILRLQDSLNGDTATLLSNDGTLLAGRAQGPATGGPYTLRIETADTTADVDLDGASNNGQIVIDNDSVLDLAIGSQSFAGTLELKNNSELQIGTVLSINSGAVVNVNAGTAGEARVSGGFLFPNGSSQVNVNSGTLVMQSGFNPTSFNDLNVSSNAGIRFESNSNIGGDLILTGAGIVLDIDANVTINDAIFDWDGGEDAVMNVNRARRLTVNATDISPSAVDDSFDGTINLVGGELTANISGGWDLAGDINLTEDLGTAPVVSGTGALNVVSGGRINALSGAAEVSAGPVFQSGGGTLVDASAELAFTGSVTFTGGSSHTGAGTLAFYGSAASVSGATTINMTGDVLLDAADASNTTTLQLTNDLTVNAKTVGDFGAAAPGSGTDLITINNNSSTLTVNQSAASSWTLGPEGQISIFGGPTISPAIAGDDLTVEGQITVVDNSRINSRVDIVAGGAVTVNVANSELRLGGGSLANPNTIAGGAINGVGEIGADAGKALAGHGTISADVRFQGNAALVASGGTLTVNGSVLDAGIVEVENGATLSLGTTFNTGNVTALQVDGQVQGSGIVNNGVTRGSGTIATGSFLNNGTLEADDPNDSLTVNTTGAVDLDGSGITGQIAAVTGSISILDPLTDAFGGDATIGAGRSLGFSQGWTLGTNGDLNLNGPANLNAGAAGAARVSNGAGAQLDGTVNVSGLGGLLSDFVVGDTATVNLPTLGDRLLIFGSAISVEAGATFAGDGLVTLNSGATVAFDDNAVALVAFENDGRIELGDLTDGIGQAVVKSLDQSSLGALAIDIGGAGLQDYDQLGFQSLSNIDGDLDVSLVGGFTPSLGHTFTILSGSGALVGEFDTPAGALPTLGGGLGWEIDYTGLAVVLSVVQDSLAGDYNNDGQVGAADYAVWRDGRSPNGPTVGDYNTWRSNFGAGGMPIQQAAAIPEPAAWWLAAMAVIGVGGPARRR